MNVASRLIAPFFNKCLLGNRMPVREALVLSISPLQAGQVRMAGHNKWSNIRHIKAARDQKMSKLYTLYGHKMKVVVNLAGGNNDPEMNSSLKKLVSEAMAQQVPKATIEKLVKGSKTGSDQQEFLYEMRGPGRVGVLVEVLVKNKATMDVKMNTILRKFACTQERGVVNMFERKGVIITDIKKDSTFDDAETDGIEVGAEEVNLLEEDGEQMALEFLTSPTDLATVRGGLERAGYVCQDSSISYIPNTWADPSPVERGMLNKLLDRIQEEDIVTTVHTNAD